MINKLVFASKNKNKFLEIKDTLKNAGIVVIGVDEYFNPEETGDSFEENSYIKALEAATTMGLPALADDSGLVVDALDGRPGVHSSRYEKTDEKRIDKLLQELKNVPQDKRTARFACSMVVVAPNGDKLFSTTQTCEGEIGLSRAGQDGFGYDPVFYLPQKNATMAELTLEEKNELSHRGKALKKTVEWLVSTETQG